MGILSRISNCLAKIPTAIWLAIIGPSLAFGGAECQRWRSTTAYPEINIERIQALEGTWEGYGIQPVTDGDSEEKLRKKLVQIRKPSHPPVKDLLISYNECAAKKIEDADQPTTWFAAHLTLKVVQTTLTSRKSLEGVLELTPTLEEDELKHSSNTYNVTGKLEQGGDYIRLDYRNMDGATKDFGTLLLENTGDKKLCGQFMSYGPISNSIASGKYIFTSKSK
jgi:hypothetical protein